MAYIPDLFARATNANGTPESGAKRLVYQAGTTTPVTTYSDSAQTTAQAFPLVSDSGGAFDTSFLPTGVYKIRVTDADDNLLEEHDNIRVADRPDDPVFFDDVAAVLADTSTYTTGQFILSKLEGISFTALASGATDFTDTNAGGQKLMRKFVVYDDISALVNSVEPARGEGATWYGGGYRFTEAASSATDQHITTAGGVKLYFAAQNLDSNSSVFLGTISPNTQDGLNVGIGRNAMRYQTKDAGEPLQRGVGNVAIGADVMAAPGLSADYNVGIGYLALTALTTGYCNSAIGLRALGALTTGQYNTAIGCDALAACTTANDNVAVGSKAMLNSTTATTCLAIGTSALYSNTTGSNNCAVGISALYSNTTGTDNTGVGNLAGQNITTATKNTLVGNWTGRLITTGARNTALGDGALGSLTTGSDNTVIGRGAAQAATTTSNLTAVGTDALSVATGTNNTAVGRFAGFNTSTGTGNTYVGSNAGNANTTGVNNTGVGDSALSTNAAYTQCTGIGYNSQVTGNNQIQLGASTETTYAYGAVQDRSDARDKADIRDTELGLSFVNDLRPVDFRWDYREDYEDGVRDGSQKRTRYHHGLIAQEVQEVMEKHGVDFGGLQDHSQNGGADVLSIGYAEMIGPLIRAVQELSAEIESLKA